ncbi:oligosaccharide repeat unit polymerase [Eubacterium sp. AM28-29]|nr:oligosaccharide repeat unit polymerase [Eubacterium sp. AM28-29]
MILFIFGIVLLIISFIFKNIYSTLINPASIFSLMWGIIFTLYSLKLFNIYSVENYVLFIYSIGALSFIIGCIPVRFKIGERTFINKNRDSLNNFNSNQKQRFFLLLFSFITMVILLIKAYKILPYWSGGVSSVKLANAEGYILYPAWFDILYTFFARPFEMVCVFVVAVDFFFGQSEYTKLQFMVTSLIVLFGYIATGSKFSLIIPVLSFVLVYEIYQKESNSTSNKKTFSNNLRKLSFNKKIIILSLSLMIILFIIYMLNQKYSGWKESIYMYLVGCIPCGGNALKNSVNNNMYFSMVSFNGVYRVISTFFTVFGIKLPYASFMNEAYNMIETYEKAIYISPTTKYNAFISIFTYFYKDGGLFFVILASFFFGRVSNNAFLHLINEKSIYSLLIYLFICYLILFSIVRSQLFLAPTVMTYIYIFLFFRKSKE